MDDSFFGPESESFGEAMIRIFSASKKIGDNNANYSKFGLEGLIRSQRILINLEIIYTNIEENEKAGEKNER